MGIDVPEQLLELPLTSMRAVSRGKRWPPDDRSGTPTYSASPTRDNNAGDGVLASRAAYPQHRHTKSASTVLLGFPS